MRNGKVGWILLGLAVTIFLVVCGWSQLYGESKGEMNEKIRYACEASRDAQTTARKNEIAIANLTKDVDSIRKDVSRLPKIEDKIDALLDKIPYVTKKIREGEKE